MDEYSPSADLISEKCSDSASPEYEVLEKSGVAKRGDYIVPTQCEVCGVPTNCLHYDVPSCSGCKNFFCRSLMAKKRYVCRVGGLCSTLQGSIKRCKACRFDRCVLSGMNPKVMKVVAGLESNDLEKFSVYVKSRKQYLTERHSSGSPLILNEVFNERENQILDELLRVESKFRRVRESTFKPDEVLYRQSLRDIIHSTKNVLTEAEKFSKPYNWPLATEKDIAAELSNKGVEQRPHHLVFDVYLGIQMARTFPVFSLLDFRDQEIFIKHTLMVSTVLTQGYYSCELKSDTLTMPDGFMPMRFTRPRATTSALYADQPVNHQKPQGHHLLKRNGPRGSVDDPEHEAEDVKRSEQSVGEIVNQMKENIFCRVMLPFLRIGLTNEEFVLLKAIIFSHSAIPELSDYARELLKKVCERYSKILLNRLQIQLGLLSGARKYAEVISLIDTLFRAAQAHKEFHVYIQMVRRMRSNCPPFFDSVMYV